MPRAVSNATHLKRLGWRVKGSGPSALYLQPGTDRWFKESHALLVLQQLEASEEIGRAVQGAVNVWEKYMKEVITAFEPTVDDFWPKITKAHRRLKVCSFRFGCSVHTQIVYDEKAKKFLHTKEEQ